MLDRLDDYPIHQTAEPIAHLATTDRNAYNRSWCNGFSVDGEWYSSRWRVSDGSRSGIGALEQFAIGRYAPAGFTGMTDGAR